MKKKGDSEFPTKYILFILTFVCAACIVLSIIYEDFGRPVKNAAATVVIPIQEGMNKVGGWMAARSDDLKELRDVMKENESLKKEIESLKEENTSLLLNNNKLKELQELLGLSDQYSTYNKVAASVISKDSSNWFSSFIIDKGSEDGIAVDMNVIGNGGLIGIITKVGNNYAVVRSIIDDSSSVSAQFSTTQDTCIVDGDLKLINEGILPISNINKDITIADGDMVVTSNISSKFLPGILIGYVKEISNDSNNLTKSGYITPIADFAHISDVLVITELKVNIEE
ncbi:MAG: rod shape-determining protein MreC [Lachnospiraceae bacterium]|nr:rod shape-determining protein MreC [Lachnospiraceae bacterium]